MSLFQGPSLKSDGTLLDIFRSVAKKAPRAIAIESSGLTLTYSKLLRRVERISKRLKKEGVGAGDKVSVQLPTGGIELYETILGVLFSGAAYVPVDHEDSPERLSAVNRLADVKATIGESGLAILKREPAPERPPKDTDDAWVIFTSGTTGVPKGVAVTHKSAVNLVLSEKQLFLKDRPLAPGDRVAATLSPAFDASIEEMWLAWCNGATLVPIDRKTLVSGPDLADALVAKGIDAISTVPSIASFLVGKDLGKLRLLILGGEAVTSDLAAGLVEESREVWNTYGPTEATIITTAKLLSTSAPITIGEPLPETSVAIVDDQEHLVSLGQIGQLVISGTGLARYIDDDFDSAKYRALPSLGWKRAYFTGDFVRATSSGIEFVGRIDEQIKIAGKRIDLTEVEKVAAQTVGVSLCAAVANKTPSGENALTCYIVSDENFAIEKLKQAFATQLPAGINVRIELSNTLPLRTSGKVDKAKLAALSDLQDQLPDASDYVSKAFLATLGIHRIRPDDNFFSLGGTSIQVAHLVVELRRTTSRVTVADVYKNPTPRALRQVLQNRQSLVKATHSTARPPLGAGTRTPISFALQIAYGCFLGLIFNLLASAIKADSVSAIILLATVGTFCSGLGRALVGGLLIRAILIGVRAGIYRRNGLNHLRLWLAERTADLLTIVELSGTPWMIIFAKLTGSRVGKRTTIESLPPVTGGLTIGEDCWIGRDVHLSGWTIIDDELEIAGFEIGDRVSIGNRAFLAEGTSIGSDTEIGFGTLVNANVSSNFKVFGSPMEMNQKAVVRASEVKQSRLWGTAYYFGPSLLGLQFLLQIAPVLFLVFAQASSTAVLDPEKIWFLLILAPAGQVVGLLLTVFSVRQANRFIKPGIFAINSKEGFASWFIERQIHRSRRQNYWIYASVLTPLWLRLLGAKVGKNCEISTFNGQPALMDIADECFLADDVAIAVRSIDKGSVALAAVKLESRVFIGNSAQVPSGTCVSSGVLVGVASAVPMANTKASSFLGLPPIEFPRHVTPFNNKVTYQPRTALKVKRLTVEIFRLAPYSITYLLYFVLLTFSSRLATEFGLSAAFLLFGVGFPLVCYLAVLVTVLAKWLLVGRVQASNHALWTNFVWRNELVWNFIESLAIPWTSSFSIDTPLHNHFLRMLGARIGRNASVGTWFFDDPDLIVVGDNSTLIKSSDLQTHLFHDRIMQLSKVTVGEHVTVGAGTFVLPGASVQSFCNISAGSLIARDETVLTGSRVFGNPIEYRS